MIYNDDNDDDDEKIWADTVKYLNTRRVDESFCCWPSCWVMLQGVAGSDEGFGHSEMVCTRTEKICRWLRKENFESLRLSAKLILVK